MIKTLQLAATCAPAAAELVLVRCFGAHPQQPEQTQNMKALRNIHTVCVSSIAFTTLLATSFLPTRAVGQESQSVPRRQIIEALNKKDAQTVCKLAKAHPELYDTKGSDGMTPLHVAAALGQKDTVLLLLGKGADVNAKSNDADTPLHVAAITNNKDVAELLLVKGAGIDAKNAHGVTPLYYAVARGGNDIVELLLTKGANINVKADDGKTLLSLAIATHRDAIAALLRAKGAKE